MPISITLVCWWESWFMISTLVNLLLNDQIMLVFSLIFVFQFSLDIAWYSSSFMLSQCLHGYSEHTYQDLWNILEMVMTSIKLM